MSETPDTPPVGYRDINRSDPRETPDTPSTEALTPLREDVDLWRVADNGTEFTAGWNAAIECIQREVVDRRQEAADTSGLREARLALEFVADWAHDSADGDTLYGFAAVETMTRDALAALRGATERPLDVLAPCRTCGNLRDTPMHELGCAAGRIVGMFDGNPMIEPSSEFGEAVANLRDVLASPTTTEEA